MGEAAPQIPKLEPKVRHNRRRSTLANTISTIPVIHANAQFQRAPPPPAHAFWKKQNAPTISGKKSVKTAASAGGTASVCCSSDGMQAMPPYQPNASVPCGCWPPLGQSCDSLTAFATASLASMIGLAKALKSSKQRFGIK